MGGIDSEPNGAKVAQREKAIYYTLISIQSLDEAINSLTPEQEREILVLELRQSLGHETPSKTVLIPKDAREGKENS
jgi:hypothetical protein